MTITRIPETKCPNCGNRHTACGPLEGEWTPDPGDWSVCLKCGHVRTFAEDLSLRELTDAERILAEKDPDVIEARRRQRTMRQ